MADALMNGKVLLHQGEDMCLTRVIQQSVDSDGKIIGKHNNIPILDNILYDVEFPDGAVKLYVANIIAENILNQVDEDGYHNQLINTILDQSKDIREAEKTYKWIVTKLGRQSLWQNTVA